MSTRIFDRRGNPSIVKASDKETPPEGATNAIRGLTDHAGIGSMAAEGNSNVALSSRQLLPAAVDGFLVSRTEYCEPPLEELDNFAGELLARLSSEGGSSGPDTATRQSFREFLSVVATMMTKEANKE